MPVNYIRVILTTSPRYEPDRISERSGHAVVVGASMAEILAARVLVGRFEAVTLIERDSLPNQALARPGVPQGNQIHVMLTAGQSTLEDFFPGYGDELTSEGAVEIDLTSDLKVYGRAASLLLVRTGFRCSVRVGRCSYM